MPAVRADAHQAVRLLHRRLPPHARRPLPELLVRSSRPMGCQVRRTNHRPSFPPAQTPAFIYNLKSLANVRSEKADVGTAALACPERSRWGCPSRTARLTGVRFIAVAGLLLSARPPNPSAGRRFHLCFRLVQSYAAICFA